MIRLLWLFFLYSLVGFGLELLFARVTHAAKTDRKCLLFLPLCPVYGLGACLILLLAPLMPGPLWVMAAGGLAATGAELAMGLFYRFALGVRFWDYTGIRGSLGGLVCPRFSLYWTALALALVYLVHPAVSLLAEGIPAFLAPPAAILLGADGAVSCAALRRAGDTDVLKWYAP